MPVTSDSPQNQHRVPEDKAYSEEDSRRSKKRFTFSAVRVFTTEDATRSVKIASVHPAMGTTGRLFLESKDSFDETHSARSEDNSSLQNNRASSSAPRLPSNNERHPKKETPRRSRNRKVKTSPAIDDSQVENAIPTEPPRLKSIMSVTNLADSLAGMDRVVSAPNLAGMTSMKRNVSFHKIEIREYQRTLGDNPSVSSGPPVTLDWKYNPNHHILNVDDYEKNKKSRSKVELVMPKSIREDILREYCEVSRSQMTAVAKEINITKRNRRATALSTDAQEKRTEMLQSVSRKVKRTLSFSKKKEEHMLWKNTRTTSGMRVHSMNDLYTTGLQTSNSISFERKGTTDSTKKELRRGSSSTELSLGWERESISSVEGTLLTDSNDDDGWGFGYDIEE